MKKLVSTTYFFNDAVWLEKHGDRCWEYICSAVEVEKPFKSGDIAQAWADENNITVLTARRQINLVLTNVLLEERRVLAKFGHSWKMLKGEYA